MKSLITLSLASAAVAVPNYSFEKRQGLAGGLSTSINGKGYGKVAGIPGAAPLKVNLPARATDIAGSKTIKMRYGPYKIPNVTVKNKMGEEGMLWNHPDTNIAKPCEECTIVGMNAGLEYADGKNANIDTGLWLHHYVQFNVGQGRSDASCIDESLSLPHILINSSPSGAERLFSSGNERTPMFLKQWGGAGKNVGYPLKKTDKFAFIVDLMNTNKEDKTVYLTVTYDIVDGINPAWDAIKPVWFDAAQCGTSEVKAVKETGSFDVTAPVWVANFNGEVLGAAGHLHDGGSHTSLEVDGKEICTSTAGYGESPEFVEAPGAMADMPGMGGNSSMTGMDHGGAGHADGGHAGGSAMKHISSMTICESGNTFKIKDVKVGQKWVLKGYYDFDKNPGHLHSNGKQSSVMSIAIMFVRTKAGETVKKGIQTGKMSGGLGGALGVLAGSG